MTMFFSKNSPIGLAKKAKMVSRFLSPIFPGQDPSHRITWERMQKEIAPSKQKTVERMRMAQTGGETAEAYVTMSPVEVFCQDIAGGFLPSFIRGYNSANGFDWDAFLFVANENVEEGIKLYLEIFPRLKMGQVVREYTSFIRAEIPFFFGLRDNDLFSTMGDFIFGDTLMIEGESRKDHLTNKHERWMKHTGMWSVEGESWTSLFINRSAMSVVEAGLGTRRTTASRGLRSLKSFL